MNRRGLVASGTTCGVGVQEAGQRGCGIVLKGGVFGAGGLWLESRCWRIAR